MSELPNKELLRPDEVAKYLSVSRKTIYLWIDTGKLDAVRISRLIRIPRKSVLDLQKPAIN